MLSTQNRSNKLSFSAGLNYKISSMQYTFDCNSAVSYLKKYNINSNFLDNKPIALSTTLAINIINKLRDTFGFFPFWSPSINVYKKNNLLIPDKELYHFCIPEEKKVLSNQHTFKPASIFYSDIKSLDELNFQAEKGYDIGIKPSNHFLSDIIHEMMHAIYLNRIYEKYGKAVFPILRDLQHKHFSKAENEIISNILGKAATEPLNQYHEVFADTFTKSICDSLTMNDCLLSKNPLENFKQYPKEFINIIKKVLNI